jgi:hypothetical protein
VTNPEVFRKLRHLSHRWFFQNNWLIIAELDKSLNSQTGYPGANINGRMGLAKE